MTIQTFTPSQAPSPSSSGTQSKPRYNEAQFGDGYSQRAGDGLNPISKSSQWVWNELPIEDVDYIEGFFEARQGWDAFLWTAPRKTTPEKYICTEWSRTHPLPTHDTITATFKRVFDL